MTTVLRLECRGCRRIVDLDPRRVTPFEHEKLVCSNCGARDPIVTEKERVAPYQAGYQPRHDWFSRK